MNFEISQNCSQKKVWKLNFAEKKLNKFIEIPSLIWNKINEILHWKIWEQLHKLSKTITYKIDKLLWLWAFSLLPCSILWYMKEWPLEILANFRMQYITLSLILISISTIRKKWELMIIIWICLWINIYEVYPQKYDSSIKQEIVNQNELKWINFNVNVDNIKYYDFIKYLIKENPDFFVLEEVNKEWIKELNKIWNIYPHSIYETREDGYWIALYSKTPLDNPTINHSWKKNIPTITANIWTLKVIWTHAPIPLLEHNFKERNRHLSTIWNLVNSWEKTIILWDMNTTPWSYYFNKFIQESELASCSWKKLYQNTWPTWLPDFMRIPIDHCFYSEWIKVENMHTWENLWSDHLPIVVNIKF